MKAALVDSQPAAVRHLQQSRTRPWLWFLTCWMICAHFGFSYVGKRRSFLDLPLYTYGKLGVPFQYRTLVAWIFRGLISNRIFLTMARHAPSMYSDPYLLAYFLVTFVALLGSILATSGTIARLSGNAEFGRWSALLVVYMAYFNLILMYGLTYTLPYDVPSLFFFCMGINLIVSDRKWLYYLLLVPAVLNRETTCFLIVFFAIWMWFHLSSSVRERALKIAPHVLLQAAIWLAIKFLLYNLYAQNAADVAPNRVFRHELAYNLKEIVTPGQWPLLLSICGFTIPLLIAQRRWIRNRPYAWACAIILPLWAAGMMCVGVIVEIRIFTELAAFVAPAIALIVYHRFYRKAGYSSV